jgi:hypothetical protein
MNIKNLDNKFLGSRQLSEEISILRDEVKALQKSLALLRQDLKTGKK